MSELPADEPGSRDLPGMAKAFWTLFLLVLPWLGVVYLIARSDTRRQRHAG